MTETQNRRSRLIVNPAVQSRIIVNISWPLASALAFVALLLGWFSMHLLDEALVAQVELPSLIPVLVTVVAFLVVSFGYMVFNALKFSHRIAGPMYRLQKTLETATEGDYSVRAKLRTNDFLVEVADSLNEFLAHLELEAGGMEFGDGVVGDVNAELAAPEVGAVGVGGVAVDGASVHGAAVDGIGADGGATGSAGARDQDSVADSGPRSVTSGAEWTPADLEGLSPSDVASLDASEVVTGGATGAHGAASDDAAVGLGDSRGSGDSAELAGSEDSVGGADVESVPGLRGHEEVPGAGTAGSVSDAQFSDLESDASAGFGVAPGPQGLGRGPRISVDDLPGALPVDDRAGSGMRDEDESGLHLGVTASDGREDRSDRDAPTERSPLPGPIGGTRRGRRG